MKHTTKALAVFLFALAVALGLLSGMTTTAKAEGSNPVSYRDATVDAATHVVTFTNKHCTNYTTIDANPTTWGVGSQTTWYVVKDKVQIEDNVTLSGNVCLILCDGAALTTGTIQLRDNNLTVYAQSEDENMGKLTASGSSGITSNSAGSITINGGSVTASGNDDGGMGIHTNQGAITINGGFVTASGSYGITSSSGGSITINGGRLTASGSYGITSNGSGSITINGGSVTASSDSGAGIYSPSGAITISGGTVIASGKLNAIDGTLKVAASHAAYSSDSEITEANKIDAEEIVQGKGTGDTDDAITLPLKRYMLVEKGTAPVDRYPLWVGGTRVTNLNADDVLGDNTVIFTPAEGTTPAKLTLSGATVTSGSHNGAAIYAEGNLTIDVTADSTVTGPEADSSYGVLVKGGSVTVNGNGTLTATGGTANEVSCGVYAYNGDVTVEATGTLTGEGGAANQYSYGVCAYNGNVTVADKGTLIATGGTANQSSCGVWAKEAVTVYTSGTLTATGGKADNSYGVFIAGNVDVRGTLTGKGGKAIYYSYGVWANHAVTVKEGGTLIAEGGEATGTDGHSYGVYASSVNVNANGKLTGEGGTANQVSYGVYAYNGDVNVADKGKLNATGGKATGTNGESYGVRTRLNVTATGKLTATGGEAYGNSFGVWAKEAVTVYSDGKLTGTGGKATGTQGNSYGVYAGGNVNANGTLEGRGGKATGTYGNSFGVWANGNVDVPGTLEGRGGEATGTFGDSYGVYASIGNVEATGKLTATGGTANNNNSYGVYANNGAVTVNGTLEGRGGAAEDNSYGVYANKGAIIVNANSTLTGKGGKAEGNSYGVYANNGAVIVNANSTLIATGNTQAVHGTVKNAIPGTGWKDAAGTDGENQIPINDNSGQPLNYKKVAFPVPVKYSLWVGGVQANSANMNDLLDDDATVKFTPETDTAPARLTLNGAHIAGNHEGAAIYAVGSAVASAVGNPVRDLTIEVTADSTVTGPEADNSYGVYSDGSLTVTGSGTLTATGGKATGANGGSYGVWANQAVTVNGTLTATGGTATDNKGSSCGVYAYNGNVTVNGTLTGKGGKATGADGGSYGVYAYKGAVNVNDNSKLTATGNTQAIGGTVKNAIAGTGWTDPTGVRGEVQLPKNADPGHLTGLTLVQFPAHFHSFKYAADGATITATCSADGCRLLPGTDGGGDHVATLTVAADGGVYDGATAFSATVTDDIPAVEGVTVGAVEYYRVDAEGATAGGTKQDSAPIDVGYYYASVTLTSGSNSYTAIKAFTVAKADPGAPTVTMGGYTYGGTVSTPDISANPGSAPVAYYYSTTDSASGGTAWENITATTLDANVYYMYAVIAESDNYNGYTTATASFNVSKAAAQTIEDVTDSQFYSLTSVSQSVAGKMPDDAGTLTYTAGTAAMTGSVTVSDFAVDDSGNVTAALSGGAAGDTVTLPVIISATNYADSTVNVVITLLAKGTQTVAAENVTVTYGDTDKAVSASVTEPATGGGAISYAVKDGSGDYIDVDAATGALTIKRVPADGIAYVTATAAATDAFEPATTDVTVTVNRANAVPATVAANNRVCDGEAKPLVTVDNTTLVGGEMQYAPGTATEATEPYAPAVPTATDVGTYYVWYRAVGDENHNSTDANCIEVKISPADRAALNEAIANAETCYNDIAGYADIAATLKSAIDAAKAVAEDENVAESEIAAAISTLNGAVDAARAAVKAAEEEAARKAAEEEAARKAADQAAAQAVIDRINALPDNAGTSDKEAVEAARAAYEALTDNQKKLVPDDVLAKLIAAEAQVKAAEEAAAKIDIADCRVTVKNRTYTGKKLMPPVTVRHGNAVLTQGVDYTLAYRNNRSAGTATVKVTGIGNCVGSKKATFNILPVKIGKCSITVKDQTCTGKAITPVVTVKFGDKKLQQDKDYTLAYDKKTKDVGKATVTVRGVGNFTGSVNKTFKIVPQGTKFTKLTGGQGLIALEWKQRAHITGYQIEYSRQEDFTDGTRVTVKDAKRQRAVVRNLKTDAVYYVRIRTYAKVGKLKYCAAWSKPETVKTTAILPKKVKIRQGSEATLMVGNQLALTVKLAPKNAETTVTWTSSDANVATVSEKGVVKAVFPGRTTITATTANNKTASITILVMPNMKGNQAGQDAAASADGTLDLGGLDIAGDLPPVDDGVLPGDMEIDMGA